jgi:hypothetical protein
VAHGKYVIVMTVIMTKNEYITIYAPAAPKTKAGDIN